MDDTIEGQVEEPVNDEPAEVVPTTEDESEEGLPDEVSERTRREFEKLKETNRILAEKAAKAEKYEAKNALDVLGYTPSAPTPPPVAAPADYIDEQGNVDVRGLNEALARANYTAQQAQQIAQQTAAKAEAQAKEYQVREAHAKHPWLDPQSDQFDEDAFDLVKDRLVRNWSEGKDVRLIDVADQVAGKYRKAEEAPVETTVSPRKAQSASVQRGRGQTRTPRVDVAGLKERAGHGDLDAIDALIKLATE